MSNSQRNKNKYLHQQSKRNGKITKNTDTLDQYDSLESLLSNLEDGEQIVFKGTQSGGYLNTKISQIIDTNTPCLYNFKGKKGENVSCCDREPSPKENGLYNERWRNETFVTLIKDSCRSDSTYFYQLDERAICINNNSDSDQNNNNKTTRRQNKRKQCRCRQSETQDNDWYRTIGVATLLGNNQLWINETDGARGALGLQTYSNDDDEDQNVLQFKRDRLLPRDASLDIGGPFYNFALLELSSPADRNNTIFNCEA